MTNSVKVESPKQIEFRHKLAVGAAAGVVGTCCIFPLDMVKTRLQANPSHYTGPFNCASTLYKSKGWMGFYDGLKVNVLFVMPEKAIKLAANETFREYFVAQNGGAKIKLHQEMMSGAGAGFCQAIATNPMELLKIRVQLEGKRPLAEQRPLGAIMRELGLRGMYKGTSATLLRDVPFSFLFFPLYANIVEALKDEAGNASLLSQLFAGSVAGGVSSGAVTPLDVIKTRLQMEGGITKYKNISGCFRTVLRDEGWSSLRQGMVPRMCVVSPLFGITLVAYELQKRYMLG